jgi:hypothetical protein
MRDRNDVIDAAEHGDARMRLQRIILSPRRAHRRDLRMPASIESDRIIDAHDPRAERCDRRRNANGRMHASIARRPAAASRAPSSLRASGCLSGSNPEA